MSNSLTKKRAIRSFLVSDLNDLLMVAHFWWATWTICSWLLIFRERPGRITHGCSFFVSDLGESLMVAHFKVNYNWFFLNTDLSSLSTRTELSKSSIFAVFLPHWGVGIKRPTSGGIKIPTSHSFRVGWHATLIRVKKDPCTIASFTWKHDF